MSALLVAGKNSSDPVARGPRPEMVMGSGALPAFGYLGLGPVLEELLTASRSCKSQPVGLEGASLRRRMPGKWS